VRVTYKELHKLISLLHGGLSARSPSTTALLGPGVLGVSGLGIDSVKQATLEASVVLAVKQLTGVGLTAWIEFVIIEDFNEMSQAT
jgi:hypothetical protein